MKIFQCFWSSVGQVELSELWHPSLSQSREFLSQGFEHEPHQESIAAENASTFFGRLVKKENVRQGSGWADKAYLVNLDADATYTCDCRCKQSIDHRSEELRVGKEC